MNRRDALIAGLLSAGLVALLVPFARLGVEMHHDGIMLKPALDVLSGQVLFRDTFMQYGALTCYLQVMALWIQPTLLAVKLMTVAAYGMTLFFLYASWRLILPRSLTILSCGLFMLFIPAYEKNWLDQFWILFAWSSVFAMMFQSIALYALFMVIRGAQPVRWGMILGLACACVFWCRQPVGMVMFGCLIVIWLALHWAHWAPTSHSKRSILAGMSGGFVAVNALMLGGIMVSGALPEWWYQNFTWPRKWALQSLNLNNGDFVARFIHPKAAALLLGLLLAAAVPAVVKRFRPAFSSRGILAYFLGVGAVLVWQHEPVLQACEMREGGWTALFPFIILVQAILCATRATVTRDAPKTTEDYLISAWAALSLGSLLQYYPVTDPWHMLWSLAPAFGLLVFIFRQGMGWRTPVVAVVLTVVFLPSVWVKAQSARQALVQPLVTLDQPAILHGMKVPQEQARTIGQIMATLGQVLRFQPDIPCALIGNDAMFLCFTANHANPSPYYITWEGLAENADNQKRWNYLLRVRPLLIAHKPDWVAVDDFYHRAHYVPLLYVAAEPLEIAVPEELAKTMGLKAYGMVPIGGVVRATVKP
jgi:hypothetical protein